MSLQISMCCLCLNNQIKNFHHLNDYYEKINTAYPKLLSKTEYAGYMMCLKCCEIIDFVYEFHNRCIKNLNTFTHFKLREDVKLLDLRNSVTDNTMTVKLEATNDMLGGHHEEDSRRSHEKDTLIKINNKTGDVGIETEYSDGNVVQPHFLAVYLNEEVEDAEADMQHKASCSNGLTENMHACATSGDTDHSSQFYKVEQAEWKEASWENGETHSIDIKTEDPDIETEDLSNTNEDAYMSEAVNELVPTKSSVVYQAAYHKFIKWCDNKNVYSYPESVLMAYFCELAQMNMKCSTMWSNYSMIKSLLKVNLGVDISKYLQLREYLKKQNEGYIPKKSRIFTTEQFKKFMSEAPDDKYLGMKMVLIVGISGSCRCDEMVKMKAEDIEDLGSLLHIKIPGTRSNKTRSFTVVGDTFVKTYRKYISLRPENMRDGRFFLKYQNGKCHRLVMGIHKIGSVPREVASYLKLPNWKEYTGHSLRRTSASLMLVD